MAKYLSFKTNPMYVHINNYEKCAFDYLGWTVSDNYINNEKSPRHSQYSIMITSPEITNQEELNNSSVRGKEIADIITVLIPISGLPSLNSPKFNSFSSNLEIVDYQSAPNGWSTNYAEIQSTLNGNNSNRLTVNIKFEGFCRYSLLEHSPLRDIRYMLEHYDEAKDEIRFLLFLNYSIETANDKYVYMLIGNAIEIINAIYPYKKHQNSKDRRIEEYFPELSADFHGVTIEQLKSWSNNRKETRHYNDNRNNNLPHESLSNEERIKFYRCSISLIINVIRHAFGLSHESIVFQ